MPVAAPYYRTEIIRMPALSTEDEAALFAAYRKRRTAKRREAIVRQYLYWAAELACRYCGPRMPKADAMAAANHGLMLAIEKFDPSLGKRFVMYSYSLIRRQVLYALRDSHVVNPEPAIKSLQYQYNKTERTPEDRKEFERKKKAVFSGMSSDLPIAGPAGGFPERESLQDESEDRRDVESLVETLREHVDKLPADMRDVVRLRYFPESGPGLTFPEIGKKLSCTADHACWVHGRALVLLHHMLRNVKKELAN